MMHLLLVGRVDPSSGHAARQSTCQKILLEALECLSVDLLDVFSAAVAIDVAQSASAINPESNRI